MGKVNYLAKIQPLGVLAFLLASSAQANKMPPVGERVYYGGRKDKYGSLEIENRKRGARKPRSNGVIFRDPQLGPGFEDEAPQTTVIVDDPATTSELKKDPRKLSFPKKAVDAGRRARPTLMKQGIEADSQPAAEDSERNKKSVVNMRALKISGRHKEPTIPFSKIPIHLEQTYEPLNERFIDKIDDDLPGL